MNIQERLSVLAAMLEGAIKGLNSAEDDPYGKGMLIYKWE